MLFLAHGGVYRDRSISPWPRRPGAPRPSRERGMAARGRPRSVSGECHGLMTVVLPIGVVAASGDEIACACGGTVSSRSRGAHRPARRPSPGCARWTAGAMRVTASKADVVPRVSFDGMALIMRSTPRRKGEDGSSQDGCASM
jgi:hypothetical protein